MKQVIAILAFVLTMLSIAPAADAAKRQTQTCTRISQIHWIQPCKTSAPKQKEKRLDKEHYIQIALAEIPEDPNESYLPYWHQRRWPKVQAYAKELQRTATNEKQRLAAVRVKNKTVQIPRKLRTKTASRTVVKPVYGHQEVRKQYGDSGPFNWLGL